MSQDRRDRPAGGLVAGAALLAAIATLALAGTTTTATLAGVGGVVLIGLSRYRGSRPLATVGAIALFGAVVFAAFAGAGRGQVLVAGAGTFLAWTFAHAAVDLPASVGTAPSRDHELAHVAGTSALVVGGAVPAYVVSTVEWGRVPALAVALLVLAAVALTVAIGR